MIAGHLSWSPWVSNGVALPIIGVRLALEMVAERDRQRTCREAVHDAVILAPLRNVLFGFFWFAGHPSCQTGLGSSPSVSFNNTSQSFRCPHTHTHTHIHTQLFVVLRIHAPLWIHHPVLLALSVFLSPLFLSASRFATLGSTVSDLSTRFPSV